MEKSILKKFIKRELLRFPILLFIFLVLFLFVSNKPFSYIFGIGCILDLFPKYYRYKKRTQYFDQLKKKGLSIEDIFNIEFLKKWEETHAGGLWKYCVRDGGIIAGAGLALTLSLLYAIIFPGNFSNIISEPGDMMKFIGYSYIAGATFGVILFRIRWYYNEKKFIRLTDPLNSIFKAKTASFDDLI